MARATLRPRPAIVARVSFSLVRVLVQVIFLSSIFSASIRGQALVAQLEKLLEASRMAAQYMFIQGCCSDDGSIDFVELRSDLNELLVQARIKDALKAAAPGGGDVPM